MSVWRVGRDAATDATKTRGGPPTRGGEPKLETFIDRVVKWIPGDVLALYAAGVTAIGAPSMWWLVVGVILSPIIVLLTPFATTGHFAPWKAGLVLALLAFVATAIWSLSIPNSGWQEMQVIRDHAAQVALGAAVLGLLFGLVADGVEKRLKA